MCLYGVYNGNFNFIIIIIIIIINNNDYNGYSLLDSCLVSCSEIVLKSLHWETMAAVRAINAVCCWKIRGIRILTSEVRRIF